MKIVVKKINYDEITKKDIKAFREVNKLSEAEMGDLLGVTAQEIKGYENDEIIPYPVKKLIYLLKKNYEVAGELLDIEGMDSLLDVFEYFLSPKPLKETKISKFQPHLECGGKNFGFIGEKTAIEGFNHEVLSVGDIVEITDLRDNKKFRKFICKTEATPTGFICGCTYKKIKEGLIYNDKGLVTHTYIKIKDYSKLRHNEEASVYDNSGVKAVLEVLEG